MINNKKYVLGLISATALIHAIGVGSIYADTKTGEVTASSLNVRSGPSTSYSIIGGLSKGQNVTISESKDGWHKIEYKNKEGWTSGKYISIKSSDDNSTPSTSKKLKATAGLNVRSGGSTQYDKVGYISKGGTVEMLGVASSGWYKVKLSNGVVGYASNDYLVEVNSSSGDSNTDNNTNEKLVSVANLNVRSGPSTSNSIIGIVYKGESVEVIERTTSSWYKVKLSSGKVGYCSAKYLKSQEDIDSSTNKPQGPEDISHTMQVKAYAYHTGTITATGTKPTFGRTIAVDPTVIPYGTRIYIPEFDKTFIAEDCGGGIKGNKIDIFMNTREECINWGVRDITLYILK